MAKSKVSAPKEQSPPALSSTKLAPVGHFSSVRKARLALQGKALELLEEYRMMIKQAAAAGKYEEALKAQQWLLDHTPGEDGERMFEASIDKTQPTEAKVHSPIVQIGFQLGGLGERPQIKLPEASIDGEVVKKDG